MVIIIRINYFYYRRVLIYINDLMRVPFFIFNKFAVKLS